MARVYMSPEKRDEIERIRNEHYARQRNVLATGNFDTKPPLPRANKNSVRDKETLLSKGAIIEDDDLAEIANTREAQKKFKDPLNDEIRTLPDDVQDMTRGPILQDDAEDDPTLLQTGDITQEDVDEHQNKKGNLPDAIGIPENFRELAWNDARSLAKNFTDQPVTSKEHAYEIIEAEVKRRADAAEQKPE